MKPLKLIIILLIPAALLAVWDLQRFHSSPLPLQTAATFEVTPGMTLGQVISSLQQRSILSAGRDSVYFELQARLSGRATAIKAGEYEISPGVTAPGLLSLLVAGRTRQYALTVLEGWTFAELRDALRRHPAIRQTLGSLTDAAIMQRVVKAVDRPAADPEMLKHPEGWFFPDTYLFPRGLSDLDFLVRAHRRMRETLDQVWESKAENIALNSPYEALILASIIEKETPLVAEHRRVSGVFHRRLKLGMRLQTDPTVIYGIGPDFDGNIRRRDLRRDTPYNTYTRHGLPPTPIAMPGRAAIEAAVDPADGDSLYFVATGDGGHHFSSTLEQHNAAVRRYLLNSR